MKTTCHIPILTAALAGAIITSATADNSFYNRGDLVLYFQRYDAESGEITETAYVGLGSAAQKFRGNAVGPDQAHDLNFLDIGANLEGTFGPDWATDPNVFVGLAGVYATVSDNEVFNQDVSRTLYVSARRDSVGTVGQPNSAPWVLGSNTFFSSAASDIESQNDVFDDTNPLALQGYNAAYVDCPPNISGIDNFNPVSAVGEIVFQGAAFGVFDGGVSQQGSAASIGTIGPVTSVEFALDLYRIVPRNVAGAIDGIIEGTTRTGTYEGTIVVKSDGKISFLSQGAATSAYDTWMAQFPSITAPADKLPAADPDGDSATNLEEFGFGGNPASGSDSGIGQIQTVDANNDTLKDLTLTLEVRSGATFSLSGNDLVSNPIDELTYRIEGSTDLAGWDSVVSEVTPLGSGSPSSGYVFKTFRLNAANGLAGKGFLRASVTK